jgi:hypothetical protein
MVLGGLLPLVLLGVMDGTARADATVEYIPGPPASLSITVPTIDAVSYGLNIAPDTSSELISPMTVGQLAFGNPTINSSSADCHRDIIFNRETCAPGPFSSIHIQLNNTATDTVRYVNHALTSAVCEDVPPHPRIQVAANLGPGNDTFSVETGFGENPCPSGTEPNLSFLDPVLNVDGGNGNDHISGGPLDDTLEGGFGDDVLQGGEGRDTLEGGPGNDLLEGGGGDDVLRGFTGNDTLRGGPGNDLLLPDSVDGSDGADTLSGGPGFDTVDYRARTCPMTITIDGAANDGCPGEHDNIIDTDQFLSGSGNDHITGSSAPEVIDGGPGDDFIDGGGGSDELRGGAGNDTIVAVDGTPDRISCGPGTDAAVIDLTDTLVLVEQRTPVGGVFPVSDCESVIRQAVDDSPPGRPLRRPVRVRRGAATVRFHCLATSNPGCRGQLVVSDLYRPQHALAATPYALKLGATATIRLPLGRAAVAELRRSRHVLVSTVEQGHSSKGPRSSQFELPVAG